MIDGMPRPVGRETAKQEDATQQGGSAPPILRPGSRPDPGRRAAATALGPGLCNHGLLDGPRPDRPMSSHASVSRPAPLPCPRPALRGTGGNRAAARLRRQGHGGRGAQQDAAPRPDAGLAARMADPRRPQRRRHPWKIEGKGAAPSYLLGTMHVTDERLIALVPRLDPYFGPAGSWRPSSARI